MGPLSRIRALLTAFLVMLPRKALAPSLYRGGSQPFLTALTGGEVFVDIAAGLFLAILVVVSGRRLIGAAPGAAMARLAMPLSGGSAQSGALRAAAGGGPTLFPPRLRLYHAEDRR